MATKDDMSRALNDYLDIKPGVDWTKLSKQDLETIIKLFDDPKDLMRRIARREAEDKLRERSRDIIDKVEETLGRVPRPFGILGVFYKDKRQDRGEK